MFKKQAEAKTQQRLSGADRKKLKRTIRERFPNATEPHLDSLLPPKAEITVSRFPNRILVYGLEGGFPMFFDVDGRGTEIYPTVYALWMVPELLPTFMLRAGEVSRFLIGGADLMFPGVYIPEEGLLSFLAGEPWAVKVPGNPAPIAVGATTMSSDEALKAGLRGKALRITHCYGDSLWGSVEGRHVPNAGFFEDVVFHDPSLLSSIQTSVLCEADPLADQQLGVTDKEAGEASDMAASNYGVDPVSTTESAAINDTVEQVVTNLEDLSVTEKVPIEEANAEDQHVLSTEDVDTLLDKCLLQALHTTIKDKELPIPGSTLWSNHVIPCRPSGVTLDIKKSSHKKLSKWLLSRSAAGLISVKEDKHKKEVILSKVNRTHPDYMSFTPEKRKSVKTEESDVQTTSQALPNKVLEVMDVYKPSVHVNPIFSSVGAVKENIYSASEATDVVFRYIEQEKLVKPTDKSTVVLDATLCDALYKGAIKKGSTYPTEVHKKDVGSAFLNRMQAHHLVTRGNESVVKKGALKTVQILTERRQGNKKVTKLSGFESFLLDAESLASELQKKFACSTSVTELPGKKGHEVLVQGGVIDNLGKHLVEQYGIPKKYIEVFDKTKRRDN